IEEQRYTGSLELQDDVGLRAAWLVASTSEVKSATATDLSVNAPLLTGTPEAPFSLSSHAVSSATLLFGAQPGNGPSAGTPFTFGVTGEQGAVRVTPHVAHNSDNGQGQLRLKVAADTHGAQAHVSYHLRPKPQLSEDAQAELVAFKALFPSGDFTQPRVLTLDAGNLYEVDLGFPKNAVEVEQVLVSLHAVGGDSRPVLVSELALRYQSGQPHQVRVAAGGQRLTVDPLSSTLTAGQLSARQAGFRIPAAWTSTDARLTTVAVDTAGVVAKDTRVLKVVPDTVDPTVAFVGLGEGASAVTGQPFKVRLRVADNASLSKVQLLVNGEPQGDTLLVGTSQDVELTLQRTALGPITLNALVTDRAGNDAVSLPVFVQIVPDAAPTLQLDRLVATGETIHRAELESGFVSLLQGKDATLHFTVKDDVGVASVTTTYGNGLPDTQSFTPAATGSKSLSVGFTPPMGADGQPTVLTLTVKDTANQEKSARLVIESRRPRAPQLAFLEPAADAYLVEGSIQLRLGALAADDTKVTLVEFFVNGKPALQISERDGTGVPTLFDEEGNPVAADVTVRDTLTALRVAPEDISRFRIFRGLLSLPPGFVRLDPTRTESHVLLRVEARDLEGNRSSVERRIRIAEDTALPVATVLRPSLGRDVIENTPVLIQVQAHDNAFVDRVEIYAGPSAEGLKLIHVAGGFPSENGLPGSPFDVYSPVVTFQHSAPKLSELGGLDLVPYFIATRARDISGNQGELEYQQIDIVRDREPALAILSPSDGTTVVADNPLPVILAAEDDVGVTSVSLYLDDQTVPIATLNQPPFRFMVPVPASTGGTLRLRGHAVDSFEHEVSSQTVVLSVVGDQPPTVAIAQPAHGAIVTEGRDFAVLVAAQDDVEVQRVEVTVEGGVEGPLRFASATRPYSFRVPLPHGSAERHLTIRANARDSSGKTVHAREVTVQAKADTQDPVVKLVSPANGSAMVSGLRMDVEARAEDNVGVAGVTFFVKVGDGAETQLAQVPAPPYRFSYLVPKNLVTEAGVSVPLRFTARAVDLSNRSSTDVVTVSAINDKPPTVALRNPPFKVVAKLPSTFATETGDDVAVSYVTFLVGPARDQLAEVGRRFQLPFEHRYVADPSDVGKRLWIAARAVDTAGQATQSEPIAFNVVADQLPTVELTRPEPDGTVFAGARLRLEANAVDVDSGIEAVSFFVDGRKVATALTPAGIPGRPNAYVGSFVAPIGSGSREFFIKAVAVDKAGQEVETPERKVGTIPDTTVPEVELVDPPHLDVVTEGDPLLLSAFAEDNAGIHEVAFHAAYTNVAGQSVSEQVGASVVPVTSSANRPQYRYSWLVPTPMAGKSIALHAVASDLSGNPKATPGVQVEAGMRPSRAPYKPFGGSGESTRLSALAVDGEGLGIVGATGLPKGAPFPRGVEFFRVTDAPLAAVGGHALEGVPVASAFHDGLALVSVRHASAARNGELVLFKTNDAANITRQGSIELSGPEVGGVVAAGQLAFVANGAAGVVVVDLSDRLYPQRVTTLPTLAPARDVAVLGDKLLVAAGTSGLRVFDLLDPKLGELGHAAVPGGAETVTVVGERVHVGCQGASASLAVVDVRAAPRVLSLLSHAPGRADLLATGQRSVSGLGNVSVSTVQLVDQTNLPVKGLLTASVVDAEGLATMSVRANVPAAGDVEMTSGGPMTLFGHQGVAEFTLPRFLVTDVTPADGEEQVSFEAPALSVGFSQPVDAATVNASRVILREGLLNGRVVTADVRVSATDAFRVELVLPVGVKLARGKEHSITVEAGVGSTFSQTLERRYLSRFRTRTTEGDLPSVERVVPRAGPVDGGTRVTIHGARFAQGARVYFSNAEATEVSVDATGTRLTARTPQQVEGPARVTVVNPGGLQGSLLGGFIFMDILQVSHASPASGPLAGGQWVELSGAGFQHGAEVFFRGQGSQTARGRPARSVTVLSPGRLRVETPEGGYGPADIFVANPDGQLAVAQSAYLYTNLSTTQRIGRYQPSIDGTDGRPSDRMPQGRPGPLVISGGRAYVLSEASIQQGVDVVDVLKRSTQGALSVIDVSVPKNAGMMGGVSFPPPYKPQALALRGTLAYVAADAAELTHVDMVGEGGPSLLVVDVSNPTAPKLVQALPYEGKALDVAVVDDLALVAAGDSGLAVFSLMEPLRPMLLGAVKSFVMSGTVKTPSVEQVRILGRHAVLRARLGNTAATLVVDLARPGFPVVGETSDVGDLAIHSGRGLASLETAATVSLAPPTLPRKVASIPSLVGTRFTQSALGPHLGVSAGAGVLQLSASSELEAPLAVDAVDLWPATSLADVGIDRGVVVASINSVFSPPSLPTPNDGFAVIAVPFPMVTAMRPGAHELGVSTLETLVADLNVPIRDVSSVNARLYAMDGSSLGEEITTELRTPVEAGIQKLVIDPVSALAGDAHYRLIISGLQADDVDGSLMPGRFVTEFRTSSDTVSRQVVVDTISPREGPVAGGTLVTLKGRGFETGLEVRIGGVPADIQSSSANEVTVRTPASSVDGAVALEVRNLSGTSLTRAGAFIYTRPLSLVSITPGRGPSSGGTKVVLEGTGFSTSGTVRVLFGTTPALRVRVLGMRRLEAYTPNGLRGAVDVSVVQDGAPPAVLEDAYIFDQPTDASVAFQGEIRDMVAIGDHVYMVGAGGLRIVDLSGLYLKGRLAGTPIPPERRSELIDEDNDRLDDRIIGKWDYLGADLLSIAYASEWNDRLFLGSGSLQGKSSYASATVLELDISNPARPQLVRTTSAGDGAAFGLDLRGDRLLTAAGKGGLLGFDITNAAFLLHTLKSPLVPEVSALAVEEGLAVVGTGTWTPGHRFTGGHLHTVRVDKRPSQRGSLALDVQRVRLRRDHWAVVAAGNEGLVLVDVSNPDDPQRGASVGTSVLKGFASDVRVVGDVAYVAVGAAGVAVVDLSNLAAPRLMHHVAGANGGSAERVAVAGGRVVSARNRGAAGWALEFGQAAELTLVSASVKSGDVVPLDLPSMMLSFSTTVTPESAKHAVSLRVDGVEWLGPDAPGADLEAGSAQQPVSTVLVRFRPERPLPPRAVLQLSVSTDLLTPDGKHLLTPFSVVLDAAADEGARPEIAQVVPRVGPTGGGSFVQILGRNFAEETTVLIGGAKATVLPSEGPASSERLVVMVPGGEPGLADVVVINGVVNNAGVLVSGSGLWDRRAGGFLYKAPLILTAATPRFLNPFGGSPMRLRGDGFLPAWAYGALGPPKVYVGTLPATGVQVVSTEELAVTAPIGSFGEDGFAEVRVTSQLPDNRGSETGTDLFEDVRLARKVGYGLERGRPEGATGPVLPSDGVVSVTDFNTRALVADLDSPRYLYSAAGASIRGNRQPKEFQGTYISEGRFFDAFTAATFDVQMPGQAAASIGQTLNPNPAKVDLLQAILFGYLPAETPWPELELTPDSLDVATLPGQVLIANGASGLAVTTANDRAMTELGRAKFGGWADPEFATRLLPTPMGSWVAFNKMVPNPPPDSGPCEGFEPAAGNGGVLRLLDTRYPADPLLVGSLIPGGEPYGMTVHGGRL
ncbi:IPT/TIG domain-containing protein, partial [Myxococcus fulvus]|uniref:IPT/TIG domain-containing protein n=1 Tax=Myxococcus fulvus TaxID=33 RepID=UPI003B99B075